jgi:hypothetical protein
MYYLTGFLPLVVSLGILFATGKLHYALFPFSVCSTTKAFVFFLPSAFIFIASTLEDQR